MVGRKRSVSLTPRTPPPNFDRLARVYAVLEHLCFGGALARRRNCFLDRVRLARPQRALILGDGDGRFTARLLGCCPTIAVTAVDSSAAMLGELSGRVRRRAPRARLELQRADVRAWHPGPVGYDVVATHFFFDCLTTPEVAAVVAKIAPSLTADASWIVSEFAIPTHGIWAFLAKSLLRGLYFAQRVLTGSSVLRLPAHAPALRSAGFALTETRGALGGVLRSELWQRNAAPPTAD